MGLQHKLTLISAPAGFGKTTLFSEWITSCERPVAWLGWFAFAVYLVKYQNTSHRKIYKDGLLLFAQRRFIMVPTLKKAEESELDEINRLIVESEMVYAGGKSNMDAFIEKYTIKKPDLLMNNSYVLYEDNFMVGFFMVKSIGNVHELEYFYIEHSRLGKGYGKILWNYFDDICVKTKIREVRIVCGKNVTPFYIRMGAEKIDEIDSKVYSGVKIDLLQYQVKQR